MAKKKGGKSKNTAVKVIVWLLIVALLGGGIYLIYWLTNGFKEDVKSFYVLCDGVRIPTSGARMEMKYDTEYTFEVKGLISEQDYSVSVLIVPNEENAYTVGGKKVTESVDVSNLFRLSCEGKTIKLSVPGGLTYQTALQRVYSGKAVTVTSEKDLYFYTLEIASEKLSYQINFGILANLEGVVVNDTNLTFGG